MNETLGVLFRRVDYKLLEKWVLYFFKSFVETFNLTFVVCIEAEVFNEKKSAATDLQKKRFVLIF